MWIVQGVTKFYIYIQSLASEVDALLRVYENDSTIDVERVPWSAFPTEGNYYSKSEDDPNLRTWRLEVISAVNDCALRSRGHTKYVLAVDLDEIIVTHHQPSLLSFLNELSTEDKNAAAFQFLNRFVNYQVGHFKLKEILSQKNDLLIRFYNNSFKANGYFFLF
ncbi:unnamed protein product [Gongylonema pulchrum]|uniref:Glycosyltransferase family 92 protein n=1 Tax=Gongylonema pulchrum TaxID=637853 RepID=A0A183D5R1_9BILA|nr:unnamed protein product [Gongylonema pulchrum]